MIRRPPRSTQSRSSAASDVYKRQQALRRGLPTRQSARVQAKAGHPRTVQRGKRYAAILTDYRADGQLVATLCAVQGLGHGWSGGAAGQPYSDPAGPDASRMIWAFAVKQFASLAA